MPVRADISVYRRIMNRQLKAADIELFAAFCVLVDVFGDRSLYFIRKLKSPHKKWI